MSLLSDTDLTHLDETMLSFAHTDAIYATVMVCLCRDRSDNVDGHRQKL